MDPIPFVYRTHSQHFVRREVFPIFDGIHLRTNLRQFDFQTMIPGEQEFLSQRKVGAINKVVDRQKQVQTLVADNEDGFFALSRRQVMVIDQYHFAAV